MKAEPPRLLLSGFMKRVAVAGGFCSSLFSERCSRKIIDFVAKPSKNVTFACALELLSFRRYLELCVQIFRRDRSGPETHESGEFSVCMKSGGVPHPTPLIRVLSNFGMDSSFLI